MLIRVHNMLEVRLLHEESLAYSKALEQEVREVEASRETIVRQSDQLRDLYDRLVEEQKVSEWLLLNLLPLPIAERLKARTELVDGSPPEIIADNFPEVSVLFADLVQFSRFTAGVSAERPVAVLNEIFSDFDGIADRRGLEKIKTIGDACMAAAGLPVPAADHAVRAAHMTGARVLVLLASTTCLSIATKLAFSSSERPRRQHSGSVVGMPVPCPFDVCVGGLNLDKPFITSSRQQVSLELLAKAALSGSLFELLLKMHCAFDASPRGCECRRALDG